MFTQDNGASYTLDQVSMAFVRAAKRADLPGISLHPLRHTFVSRLVQEGRPLPEVAALAGHSDIRMTMRYAHLAPKHLHEGIAALEARQIRQVQAERPQGPGKPESHDGVTLGPAGGLSSGGPNGI